MLNNPVFNALCTGDASLGSGTTDVKFFQQEISPFAGFKDELKSGFDDLHQLLPTGLKILYASRQKITEPKGWKLLVEIEGLQFILHSKTSIIKRTIEPLPLEKKDVAQMIALAALTKPGPFDERTIEFGHYYGIFEKEKLVAMTGQRLHLPEHTEISAVCTHPEHLGKGYAGILLDHQIDLIMEQGHIPFLHVRADNERAIALYERLGFKVNGPMNFYFLKKI